MESSKAVNIAGQIIGFAIKKEEPAPKATQLSNVVHMHEQVQRPEALEGTTYKLKSPATDHALYITFNDIVLNAGTEHEQKRPYEIFINTKDATSHQWMVGMTRMISAVFRKGGDVTFLVDELKSVFDPRGGYLAPGGRYIPSMLAEIGIIIERHLVKLGLLARQLTGEQQQLIAEKKSKVSEAALSNAQVCPACHAKAVVLLDGCSTCLECAHSKCG